MTSQRLHKDAQVKHAIRMLQHLKENLNPGDDYNDVIEFINELIEEQETEMALHEVQELVSGPAYVPRPMKQNINWSLIGIVGGTVVLGLGLIIGWR